MHRKESVECGPMFNVQNYGCVKQKYIVQYYLWILVIKL